MVTIPVQWPDGRETEAEVGQDWLVAATDAGVNIPTGCMGGSCGACEIEVNGKVVRAKSAHAVAPANTFRLTVPQVFLALVEPVPHAAAASLRATLASATEATLARHGAAAWDPVPAIYIGGFDDLERFSEQNLGTRKTSGS